MTAVQKRDVLTVDEMREALFAFSTADYVRLRKFAQTIGRDIGISVDDLTQEAVARALEGKRKCPRELEPVIFLCGVVKSIASKEREKWAREMPMGKMEPELDPVMQKADSAPSPEREAVGRISLEQTIDQIEGLFADDPQALAITMGDMEEYSPDEVRELEPMTKKEYAAARKRKRRKFDKAFPGGADNDR